MSQMLIQCIREHSDLNECNYVDKRNDSMQGNTCMIKKQKS